MKMTADLVVNLSIFFMSGDSRKRRAKETSGEMSADILRGFNFSVLRNVGQFFVKTRFFETLATEKSPSGRSYSLFCGPLLGASI